MKRCVQCGKSRFKTGPIKHSVKIGTQTYSGMIPAEICTSCDEWYIASDDLGRWEAAVVRALAAHGPVNADGLTFLRKFAGLQSKDLAVLLDVTAGTVSRWENGHETISLAIWICVGDLAADALAGRADTRKALTALKKRPPKHVMVRLTPST